MLDEGPDPYQCRNIVCCVGSRKHVRWGPWSPVRKGTLRGTWSWYPLDTWYIQFSCPPACSGRNSFGWTTQLYCWLYAISVMQPVMSNNFQIPSIVSNQWSGVIIFVHHWTSDCRALLITLQYQYPLFFLSGFLYLEWLNEPRKSAISDYSH